MSLRTPVVSVRKLQIALHAKAKAEPRYRFYSLWDKVPRDDVLREAWRRCRVNGGAAGADGLGFTDIEADGLERWLEISSRSCERGCIARSPCCVCGSPRAAAVNVRSASRRFGTVWCKPQSSSFSDRSSRQTCSKSSTASDRDETRRWRCAKLSTSFRGDDGRRSWMPIYRTTSTRSRTER